MTGPDPVDPLGAKPAVHGSPLFSVVTPVFDPPLDVLRETVESVLAQTLTDWELILVDDCSVSDEVRRLLRELAAGDDRIFVIERPGNGGIVAATNDGVVEAAGDFLVLLDHDDLLSPDALDQVAAAIAANPLADYLYSDEDKMDVNGNFYDRFNKPEFSPERLRGQTYTTHLSAFRLALVRELGGYREGFDGSQDYDLVLRVTERARQVVHIPQVLYHWRVVPGSTAGDPDAKPYAWIAGRQALQEHLNRSGIRGRAHPGPRAGYYRVERFVEPTRTVGLVIPARSASGLVWGQRRNYAVDAVRSVLASAGVTVSEVIVVIDADFPPAALAALTSMAGDRLIVVRSADPVTGSSADYNAGFATATADVVVLLADSVEVTSERFLEQLIGPLEEPDVGMTGAHVTSTDGRLLDAGQVYYDGRYGSAFAGATPDDPGPFGALLLSREVSGLDGPCLALRRSTFSQLGGLSELLDDPDNRVDLSFKVRASGHRIVWVNDARLRQLVPRPGARDRTAVEPNDPMLLLRWQFPIRDDYLPELTGS